MDVTVKNAVNFHVNFHDSYIPGNGPWGLRQQCCFTFSCRWDM